MCVKVCIAKGVSTLCGVRQVVSGVWCLCLCRGVGLFFVGHVSLQSAKNFNFPSFHFRFGVRSSHYAYAASAWKRKKSFTMTTATATTIKSVAYHWAPRSLSLAVSLPTRLFSILSARCLLTLLFVAFDSLSLSSPSLFDFVLYLLPQEK